MTSKKPVYDWNNVPIVMDLAMAGRIVSMSPEYLKKLAQQGKFPAIKVSSQWRVSKASLLEYIKGKVA